MIKVLFYLLNAIAKWKVLVYNLGNLRVPAQINHNF